MRTNKVLVIVGPTASGKSDLAVRLAKKLNSEVISADSRQVYKGLDIGTGKITRAEMKGVPHHLLDVADPKKRFSAADYKKLADKSLREIVKKNRLPIVAGGTGFYIDALTGTATLPNVPPNKSLRDKLNKLDKEKLFEILKEKDPERAKTIDPHNKVRLIRALEIIETLGSAPKTSYSLLPTPYSFVFFGLKPEDLEERIRARLKKRLDGMIREAKSLHAKGLSYKRMHELGLEYRYAALYLQDKMSKKEMEQKLNTEIRRYAKRQMTWFRRNKKIKWFKPEEYKEIEKHASDMLR